MRFVLLVGLLLIAEAIRPEVIEPEALVIVAVLYAILHDFLAWMKKKE